MSSDANDYVDIPVKIRCFDVAQALWLARADENHIGRNKVVTLNTDNVADLDIFPLLVLKGRLSSKNFGFARVELRVGLMAFLGFGVGVSNRLQN